MKKSCFRCKFIQILKAIHNKKLMYKIYYVLFSMQIYTNFESNSQRFRLWRYAWQVVFDANLYKFWKQFTTRKSIHDSATWLFSMQIYTNFESNSQQVFRRTNIVACCFRCKFIQILKAIHNILGDLFQNLLVVFDANLYKFWKQFTTLA